MWLAPRKVRPGAAAASASSRARNPSGRRRAGGIAMNICPSAASTISAKEKRHAPLRTRRLPRVSSRQRRPQAPRSIG
ncbi:hypothetical protein MOR12E_00405 [Methylobacterium oryzae]